MEFISISVIRAGEVVSYCKFHSSCLQTMAKISEVNIYLVVYYLIIEKVFSTHSFWTARLSCSNGKRHVFRLWMCKIFEYYSVLQNETKTNTKSLIALGANFKAILNIVWITHLYWAWMETNNRINLVNKNE